MSVGIFTLTTLRVSSTIRFSLPGSGRRRVGGLLPILLCRMIGNKLESESGSASHVSHLRRRWSIPEGEPTIAERVPEARRSCAAATPISHRSALRSCMALTWSTSAGFPDSTCNAMSLRNCCTSARARIRARSRSTSAGSATLPPAINSCAVVRQSKPNTPHLLGHTRGLNRLVVLRQLSLGAQVDASACPALIGQPPTTVITTGVSVASAFVPTRKNSAGTAGPLPPWCRPSAG